MLILVTGSAGFIGTHLRVELEAAGHDVLGLDRRPRDYNNVGTDYLRDLLDDRGEPKSWHMLAAFEAYRPDVVVHLAAQVGRQFGEDAPAVAALDNVGMTALVAQACAEARVRLVYASTSEVYGDVGSHVAVEDDRGELHHDGAYDHDGACLYDDLPHNVYGLTKRQAEEVCALYCGRHGLDHGIGPGFQVIRPSMPYGPGLPPGRGRAAIVNFLWHAKYGAPIHVHRGAERSWCWIGDAVRGIRLVIERGAVAHSFEEWREGHGVYNVGRDDDPRTMGEIATLANVVAGSHLAVPSEIVEVDPPSRQTLVKRLSTAKLEGLGWAPLVGIVEGMQNTRDWLEAAGWQGAGFPEGATG